MYSYKFEKDVVVGKARLEDIDASYKDLVEVCSNIRGRETAKALALLEKAALGETPIRYRKYISHLGHRRELGGKPGRYPKKAAAFVLAALKSAIASAKSKGMSEDLKVAHVSANKKMTYPRMSPKGGKRSRSYLETARIEVVVCERVPGKKIDVEKSAAKPVAKAPAPKTAAKSATSAKPEDKSEAKPEDKRPTVPTVGDSTKKLRQPKTQKGDL